MALILGARFGVYEVSAHIGEGGMGQVYRARDTKLNRDVALKILPDLFAGDPDRLARFRREAQVLASLNHPNIAQIYGLEEVGSVPPAGETRAPGPAPPLEALVLELVEGPTLADRIARGPIPPSDALPIARQIADALEAAHELGIVHRDLKPANVKARDDDAVKVLDFGLAKALGTEPASAAADAMHSPTLTARATGLGVILGTAAYMAPEQAKGRPVDKRADIWAFGCVLYEMLTGRRAFQGADVSDTLAAVLRQDVDWTALPTSVPASIRRLLARCLERDPKKRLRDIGEARLILENPLSTAAGEDAPVPAGPIARRALPWAIAASAVVAAAVSAWGWLHPAAAPPRVVTRSTMIVPSDTRDDLALSHDGRQLAYWERGPTGQHLALRVMDQLEGNPIPGTEDGDDPVFSPDGQWIAYIADATSPHRKLAKIPVTGGTSIALCDAGYDDTLTWGDDDTIVFAATPGLMRVPASGGTPGVLTASKDSKDLDPQFLPGAQGLVFTILTPSSAQHIGLLDLKTRSVRILPGTGDGPRYVPTGHLVYWRDNALFAVPFDVTSRAETGSETPVVEGVSRDGYTFSDAGLLVFKAGSDAPAAGSSLEWRNRSGVAQLLPGAPRGWFEIAASPDGTLVAATIQERGKTGQADSYDVWRYDIARDALTRLTFDGQSMRPLWTPDGKWVTFLSNHDGAHIARVPADASGPPEVLVPAADNVSVSRSSWTPDGKSLLYSRYDNHDPATAKRQIWILPADGKPRRVLDTAFSEVGAQVSPDGKWLAYESDESGGLEVYVVPFPGPGGKVQISTQGVDSVRWSRNGQELIYSETVVRQATQNESRLMSVDMRTMPPGRPEPLFTFPLASRYLWDVTPDPQRFLVSRPVTPTADSISTFVVVTDWFEELRRLAPLKPGR